MPTISLWSDPTLPIPVDYSREAVEQIRLMAMDGLLALPRVGIGTGGLLLGTNEAGRIKILDSVKIPCAHATGPSFVLTEAEIVYARGLIEKSGPLAVVGWFCSKTRAAMSLTEADQNLFSALCPAPWQIALLIKPSTVGPTKAALCFRDSAGQIVHGGEKELAAWDSRQAATPGPQSEKPGVTTALKMAATAPDRLSVEIEPRPVAAPIPEPASVPVSSPAPAITREMFEAMAPPEGNNRKWLSWLAAVAICAAISVAFLMKDSLLPRPPLKLNVSDANGHLTIRWNRDAVQGIDRGSISLDDGGKLETISLDATALAIGMLDYQRKTDRVTATMKAGESKALTSFLAPVPAPASPPAKPPQPQ